MTLPNEFAGIAVPAPFGDVLLFLHADSRPDARVLRTVASLSPDFDALGWFRLRFHDGNALLRLNALGANLRSRLVGLPFGDQGLLLPAARFRALGSFDESLPRGPRSWAVDSSRCATVAWLQPRRAIASAPAAAAYGDAIDVPDSVQ